jgi:pilus assembly protein CpaB
MKSSTVVSLLVSAFLAVAAVLGVQAYLRSQTQLMAASKKAPVAEGKIVVAAQPMRFGQVVEPAALKEIPWPSTAMPQGAFKSISEVIGDGSQSRYVMTGIEESEPILATKITGPGQRATLSATLGTGMKAVSIRVNDVLGVAGFVLPGDRVDILLTRQLDAEGDAKRNGTTDVLLQGVKVLAVDQSADDRADRPEVVKTVTLEVSTLEAQKLTLAATVGSLSLTLRNIASADIEQVAAVDLADLGSGAASEAMIKAQEEAKPDPRLDNIEKLVKDLGDKLQTNAEKPAPAVATVAQEPRAPTTVGIGVYRNAERKEYTVEIAN